MGLQMEEILEKIKVRLDPQDSLTGTKMEI